MRQGEKSLNSKPGKLNLPFAKISKYLAIGLEIPSTIIGGVLVGYFLDRYFNTSPWLIIGITFAAFVGAWIKLIRWVRYFSKTNQ